MNGSFQVTEAGALLSFLFDKLPEVKRTKVRQWLKFEGVRVNGRVMVRGDHAVKAGDVVVLDPKSKPVAGPRLPSGMKIVHEDEALMVIEKPANLLSIATKAEQEATVYARTMGGRRSGGGGRGFGLCTGWTGRRQG
jgi:23S rRNA pseudouridine1911/1915/1917 synthase